MPCSHWNVCPQGAVAAVNSSKYVEGHNWCTLWFHPSSSSACCHPLAFSLTLMGCWCEGGRPFLLPEQPFRSWSILRASSWCLWSLSPMQGTACARRKLTSCLTCWGFQWVTQIPFISLACWMCQMAYLPLEAAQFTRSAFPLSSLTCFAESEKCSSKLMAFSLVKALIFPIVKLKVFLWKGGKQWFTGASFQDNNLTGHYLSCWRSGDM